MKPMHLFVWIALLGGTLVGVAASQGKTSKQKKKARKPVPVARIFVQDLASCSLRWADLKVNDEYQYTLGHLAAVKGFEKLDPTRQKLVQMKDGGGLVCVGVRDDEDGAYQSGWVLLRSGVGYIDHGDHGHWTYRKKPEVIDSRLDAKQGNPAHLYLYDNRFFLANDKLQGYTRIDPKEYAEGARGKPRFLVGGGNHITLAVVDDRVGYSAWIDGGGPNRGRVDVTPVTDRERSEPRYSFQLPTGVIHGAIANSGRVFFAPSDGICWVEADTDLKLQSKDVKVHHIPLGKDGDKQRRTGAFVNHGHHVLFVTGKEANSALVLLDAKKPGPKPIFVPLEVRKGTQATTPHVAVTPQGKAYAFVFHDHAKGVEAEDSLDVVALDPNGDGDCSDARVVKSLKVGPSAVEGHFGHHDLAFDAERRHAFFTNPGNGTLAVLSLEKLEVVATCEIGGTPTALVACGGLETSH